MQIAELHDQDRIAGLRNAPQGETAAKALFLKPGTELPCVGRHCVLNAGVFTEGLALNPVGIGLSLAGLGKAHVELQQFAVGVLNARMFDYLALAIAGSAFFV